MNINTMRARYTAPVNAVWTLIGWLMITVSTTRVKWQRRVRAAWLALQGRDTYHGARLLPDEESIPWQARIACALGGADRALIVIKFHQWIEYNKSEGRQATTHNGYGDWIEAHFAHLKPGAFGGHVRALEKMGVLKTQRVSRRDARKSYRIDYGRLNALIARVKAASSPMKTGKSNTKGAHSNLNNDSNSSTQSLKPNAVNPNAATQSPTKPTGGRGGRREGAGRKKKEASTASSPAAPMPLNADVPTQPAPDPSPSSATPPSHPEAEIARMTNLGLDQNKAVALIERYGADRVRAVVHECEMRRRVGTVYSPPGWIIKELEKDIFKLGTLTFDEWWALPENWVQRMAAQSATVEELVAEDESPADSGRHSDDTPVEKIEAESGDTITAVMVSNPDDTQTHDAPVMTAQAVWTRAMDELSDFCGESKANLIRLHTVFIDYDDTETLFKVQTDSADSYERLREEAGTIKAVLTRLHKRPCRIKHVDR